jgi:uncharacterized protein YdhG (YjbR/CyaY superfamily)
MMKKIAPRTIDAYLKMFPGDVRAMLEAVRRRVKKVVPDAEEGISYQIPVMKLHGAYVLYFAGWKKHVSVYPIPKGDTAFREAIAPYVAGKGTVRFPIDRRIPLGVISKIVKCRVREIQEHTQRKSNRGMAD